MKALKDYNWEEIRDALEAFADHMEATEPAAINSINALRSAADSCADASEEFAA